MVDVKVLIVEDEAIVALDIKNRLEHLGYIPTIVSSGEEAVEMSAETCPDLVLMDIMLGGKIDGIETAVQIHKHIDIPIVYLTAYADDKTLSRAKITKPFGYILKPFEERELHSSIEIAIYNHNLERELKESEQWLSATLKSLGEAVIATDGKGIIKIMNPFAEALTGWTREEALGKSLAKVFNVISEGTDKRVENPITKAIREDIFYGLAEHTVLIAKEGARTPVDIIGTVIKDDRDCVIGVVLIFYDIIERIRIDETLKRALN